MKKPFISDEQIEEIVKDMCTSSAHHEIGIEFMKLARNLYEKAMGDDLGLFKSKDCGWLSGRVSLKETSTHIARLFNIEQIENPKECLHLRVIATHKQLNSGEIGDANHECESCGNKLKPTGWEEV